jgi:hypothetical protein
VLGCAAAALQLPLSDHQAAIALEDATAILTAVAEAATARALVPCLAARAVCFTEAVHSSRASPHAPGAAALKLTSMSALLSSLAKCAGAEDPFRPQASPRAVELSLERLHKQLSRSLARTVSVCGMALLELLLGVIPYAFHLYKLFLLVTIAE